VYSVAVRCRDSNVGTSNIRGITRFIEALARVIPHSTGRVQVRSSISPHAFSFSELPVLGAVSIQDATAEELELHFSLLNSFAVKRFCLEALPVAGGDSHSVSQTVSVTAAKGPPPLLGGNGSYDVDLSSPLSQWNNFKAEIQLLLQLRDDSSFSLVSISRGTAVTVFVVHFTALSSLVVFDSFVKDGAVNGTRLTAPSTTPGDGSGGVRPGAAAGIAVGALAVVTMIAKACLNDSSTKAKNASSTEDSGSGGGSLLQRWDDDFFMSAGDVLPLGEDEMEMVEDFPALRIK
jgi:hypothetical protein